MNQEAVKKSKKWLWIGIAVVAVLAIAGVVLGILLSGGSEQQTDKPKDATKGGRAELYWNIDRELYKNATTGMSVREPDANGVYQVTFAHDGEQITYPISDKRLVNFIDTADVMGLVFDEDGNVVDAVDVTNIAQEMAKRFYVIKVEGDVIYINGSEDLNGMAKQITCGELAEIYNFSGARETRGEKIPLENVKPLDEVLIYGNDLEQATHIAIMDSPVETPIYWRVKQYYNYATAMTSREPDENGIYTVEMLCNGELVSLKFRNVEDVNEVDKTMSMYCHISLIFDEEGYVVGTQPSQKGVRGRIVSNMYDVTSVDGNKFSTLCVAGASNLIGLTYEGTLTEDVNIYDASYHYINERRGKQVDTLQVGDRIVVWEDTLGNILEIYIYVRKVDYPLCYLMDKWVNRNPNEQGWYEFEIFDGESVKIYKTKDEALCRNLEGQRIFALQTEKDIILDVYDPIRVVTHAYLDYPRMNWLASNVAGTVVALEYGETLMSKIISADCKIYNLSGIDQEIGAQTTLKAGDRGTFIINADGELSHAFITSRTVEAGLYYNLTRKYNATTKTTTRVPDENGYYVFVMAHEGKQVTIKTKSKAVASKIDEVANLMVGLNPNSKGIVTNAYPGVATTGGLADMGNPWTYEGKTEEGKLQFFWPANPEKKTLITPAEDMEIYNVCNVGYSKFRGEKDTLKIGDQCMVLNDTKGRSVVMYIMAKTYTDVTKYCEHCNKKVTFKPWAGTNFSLLKGATGHYYVPGNAQGCSNSIIGDVSFEKDNDIVIDLNGKSVEFEQGIRGFVIYNGVKLSIIDTKGGGRMIATGQDGQSGGLISLSSTLNLYGGSLELAKDHASVSSGGVISISGDGAVMNIYGGKLVSPDSKLEAMIVEGGATVNIKDGTAIDSIVVKSNTTVNMTGKVKIGNMHIEKGVLLDFTKIDKKSSIGIQADGIFTTEFASEAAAAEALVSFKAAQEGATLRVEGKALYCQAAPFNPAPVIEAADAMKFPKDSSESIQLCPYCDRTVVWTPLSTVVDRYSETNKRYEQFLYGNRHYYADDDFNLKNGALYTVSGQPCVHLNGKTLSCAGDSVLVGSMTVMGNGTVKVTSKKDTVAPSVVFNPNNGIVNILGGTYTTGNDVTLSGDGAIFMYHGGSDKTCAINFYGGEIQAVNNDAVKVYSYGTFNMYGGKITGKPLNMHTQNTNPAFVNVFGGEVENLVAGEGVLNIRGGKFGSVNIGAGCDGITIAGKTTITKLNMVDATVKADVTGLTEGAAIAVNAKGVFTTDFADETAAQAALTYFTPTDEEAVVQRSGNALTCVPAPFNYDKFITNVNAQTFTGNAAGDAGYCYHCKENVTWMPLSAAVYDLASGHYYLADHVADPGDGNATITLSQSAGANICLHLNGKTLESTHATAPAIYVFAGAYKLNVMGDGLIKHTTTSNWGAVTVNPNAELNFFGCKLENTNNKFALKAPKGTINLYGVTVEKGMVCSTGGTINVEGGAYSYLYTATATAVINAKNTTATIVNQELGTINVDGSKVTTLTVGADASALKLSGKVEIAMLDMSAAAIKVDATGLTTGANVAVKYNGVFTTNFADVAAAEAASKFFSAITTGSVVMVEGTALTCIPEPFDYTKVIERANAQTFTGNASSEAGYCHHCKENVTWKPLTATAYDLASGHYYLANDIRDAGDGNATITLSQAAGGNICLHLNGKTLESTHATAPAILIWSGAYRLNLMGEGVIKNSSQGWAALHVRPEAQINIYGCKLESTNSRFAIKAEKGTLNVYGVQVEKGMVCTTGAAINIEGGSFSYLYSAAAAAVIDVKNATVSTVNQELGQVIIDGVAYTASAVLMTARAMRMLKRI